MGRTAETYTDKTENVQDAWNEMVQVFEGIDAKGATIQRAREIIRTTHWSRDTQHFKFSDYCTKHISANNDLNRYSANVDGASQVQVFLRGIKADAAINPHLLGIKTTVLMGATTKNDIYKAVTMFKDTMRTLGIDFNNDSRRISSAYSRGRGYGRGRGNGGRGRGRGRGGRGRGRGSRRDRGYEYDNEERTDSHYIPQDILENLPPKYRAMIYKGRDVMEANDQANKILEAQNHEIMMEATITKADSHLDRAINVAVLVRMGITMRTKKVMHHRSLDTAEINGGRKEIGIILIGPVPSDTLDHHHGERVP